MADSREFDISALELELCRIPEITAARVVPGEHGTIEEVHILSAPSKHAKQVVRDVQSVAMAAFDLDLDRRIISVVQLDVPEAQADAGMVSTPTGERAAHPPSTAPDRVSVAGVNATRNGHACTAEVLLGRGGETVSARAEGLVATGSVLRLVARATLDALRQLEPAATRADVESATVTSIGERAVALATVVIVVPPYEEVCSGSAVVRAAGELDAVARAVLDATNRRLPQLR